MATTLVINNIKKMLKSEKEQMDFLKDYVDKSSSPIYINALIGESEYMINELERRLKESLQNDTTYNK